MIPDPQPLTGSIHIKDYCTLADAAASKGTSPKAVYDAVYAGRLQAYSVFGATVLLWADVEKWKVRRKTETK